MAPFRNVPRHTATRCSAQGCPFFFRAVRLLFPWTKYALPSVQVNTLLLGFVVALMTGSFDRDALLNADAFYIALDSTASQHGIVSYEVLLWGQIAACLLTLSVCSLVARKG